MDRLPGFRDFYPEPVPHRDAWSAEVRHYVLSTWRAVARRHGFQEYDGPPLESLELYTTKSGDEIVGQLYHFTDKGDRRVALRPEMTPTLARMVAAHARNYRKPIKWFALPQLFRYERQQKGRLREHFQLNADLFGDATPAADAELIALLINTLRAFKLSADDFVVRLSSRQAWHDFFLRISGDPAREEEFYQTIDKLEREDPASSEEQLRTFGLSLGAVREFIAAAQPTPELEYIMRDLASRGMGDYLRIDYGVIRGLAYYTGVVFEAFDRHGEFRAIAGGGRYDNLVKLISGGKVDLPGLGFGMGDVVLTELLAARRLLPQADPGLDVYCLIEDESVRAASLRLVQDLRDQGLTVDYPLAAAKGDRQLKRALDLKARWTVRLEPPTPAGVIVEVKNLQTRESGSMPAAAVAERVRVGKHGQSGAPAPC